MPLSDSPLPPISPPQDQVPPLLPHTSLNPTGSPTLVLLHGLLSSPLEYTYVTPHLTPPENNYHVLIPYLPSHGSAIQSTYGPFTLPNAASHIARLIKQKAHSGTAHVIGLSAGGMAALHLAQHHPDTVSSLFVTGVGSVNGSKLIRLVGPFVIFATSAVQHYAPGLHEWVTRCMGMQMVGGQGRKEEEWKDARLEMLRSAFVSFGKDGRKVPLQVRTLVVAGGKGDGVEGCREVGRVLRGEGGNEESTAVVVEAAVHAWDLQFPEVFAKGVMAWVEREELPTEFKALD